MHNVVSKLKGSSIQVDTQCAVNRNASSKKKKNLKSVLTGKKKIQYYGELCVTKGGPHTHTHQLIHLPWQAEWRTRGRCKRESPHTEIQMGWEPVAETRAYAGNVHRCKLETSPCHSAAPGNTSWCVCLPLNSIAARSRGCEARGHTPSGTQSANPLSAEPPSLLFIPVPTLRHAAESIRKESMLGQPLTENWFRGCRSSPGGVKPT